MDKLQTFRILDGDKHTNSFVPETRILTEKNFSELLTKYGTIILKPAFGSGGRGIINISRMENEYFVVQVKLNQQVIASNDLYSYVTSQILKGFAKYLDSREINKILSKTYLVQYRIPLSTIEQRPFDIRVMVQRKSDSPWTVTGKLVKLASDGYAITNVNLGASILPVEKALELSTLNNLSNKKLLALLDQVALRSVERLEYQTPGIRVIGFDMCIDTHGKVWIIEANNAPDDYIFLELEDKTMYEAILEYRKG